MLATEELMKAHAKDILLYLFQNYRHAEVTDVGNRGVLHAELSAAGFADDAIRHTLLLVLMPGRCAPRPVHVAAGGRLH